VEASNAAQTRPLGRARLAIFSLNATRENFPLRPQKTCGIAIAIELRGATSDAVMADLIKAEELKNRLKKIPEWELEKKHIERTFEFDDFTESIDFVNAVAEVSEEEEHHPDIDIRYNKVRLLLSTHTKGGLTDLDFGLAERIDTLAE
jgi:4a-hydroxytetrahydrobiopterin dehydratase